MIKTDLALNKDKGYWDISISDDIDSTNGLDTSILTSMFTDDRASKSEQPKVNLRRGWWGSNYQQFSLGSKLWLTLVSPLGDETNNYIVSYSYDALQWLISDGFFDKLEITSRTDIGQGIIYLYINAFKNDIITKRVFEILQES